jgi:hypothetical protein
MLRRYSAPAITDYGDLACMTAVVNPLLDDAARRDLGFSSPGAGTGGVLAAQGSSPSSGGTASGGGGAHAGGGGLGGGGAAAGAGGGGGGRLPFTGFVPGIVAAIGAGFTAAGYAIRGALRLRRR